MKPFNTPKPGISAIFLLLNLAFTIPAMAQYGDMPPPPVTVLSVEKQDAILTTVLPGRVVASGVAEVRPQVSGILQERLFEEGTEVKEGDPLYRIEATIYEAELSVARASVIQAEVNFDVARKEADRILRLRERSVASQSNADKSLAARDAAKAALQIAKARLRSAEINLERTVIRAPLSGVIGRSLVTKGALVTSGPGSALAIIRTLDPIYVDVTASAADYVQWSRISKGLLPATSSSKVQLTLADGKAYAAGGSLTAAEPHVDPQTGLMLVRMTFPNSEQLLLPGMYVQVDTPVRKASDVFLIPQSAVSRDRKGSPTTLIVTKDNMVEQRTLTILRDQGSNWVVSKGIQDKDRVIIKGSQKAAPSSPVVPTELQVEPPTPSNDKN